MQKTVDTSNLSPRRDASENLLHLICLLLMFWFVAAGNDGMYRVDGDDIAHTHDKSILALEKGPRFLLNFAYYGYYHWLFGSFADSMLFTWLLYACSGLLLYAVLRRIYSPMPSLLAALLYLAYSSKHEVLTWFAASFYVPVILLFIVTLLLLSMNLGPLKKGLYIALLGWISMFGYEVFFSIAPVYLMFMATDEFMKEGRISRRTLVGGGIPILVLPLHLGLTLIFPGSISFKSGDSPGISIVTKIVLGCQNSIDATIGGRHFDQMKVAWDAFDNHYLLTDLQLIVAPILLTLSFAVAFRRAFRFDAAFGRANRSSRPAVSAQLSMGLVGLYVLLVGGIPSFVVGIEYTPSRLTYLTSVGLCIIACTFLEYLWRSMCGRQRLLRSSDALGRRIAATALVIFVFGYALFEAVALTSIIHQNRESAVLDRQITRQIKEIYPHAAQGELFFVSLPRHPNERFWRLGPSAFEANRGGPYLWEAYGLGPNSLGYERALRSPSKAAHVELGAFVDIWIENGIPKGLVPFFIDDRWKVSAVRGLQIFDNKGIVLHELEFMQHRNTAPERQIELRLTKTVNGYVDHFQ